MKIATKADWETKPLPAAVATIPLDREFTESEMQLIRNGHIPEAMEDRWFIYWENNDLFIHRSWTGNCIYVVRFEQRGNTAPMIAARVNRDPEEYTQTNDLHDARMIEYLIDTVLLNREVPFPDSD